MEDWSKDDVQNRRSYQPGTERPEGPGQAEPQDEDQKRRAVALGVEEGHRGTVGSRGTHRHPRPHPERDVSSDVELESGAQTPAATRTPTCAGLVVPLSHYPLKLLLPVAGGLLLLMLLLLWRERWRRRGAERATAEARSQLQTVTATMREGVIAYDMDRRLKKVNPAFERLTGDPQDELQEQEFLQYIHPE